MSRRTDGLPEQHQRAVAALDVLAGKWRPVVLCALFHRGPLGFNDILDSVPDISGKVLSETLENLEEEGLVERRVVSESPLRVEYRLTTAGSDAEVVIEALAQWGTDHISRELATVAVAHSDRRLTEMYGDWLGDRYDVFRAHNVDELASAVDDSIAIAVVDRTLPGGGVGAIFETLPPTCRTILLVGDAPDPTIVNRPCDDVLRKPIVAEDLLDAVDTQHDRRGESPDDRERAAIAARIAVLRSTYSDDTLESDPAYQEAQSRLEELAEE